MARFASGSRSLDAVVSLAKSHWLGMGMVVLGLWPPSTMGAKETSFRNEVMAVLSKSGCNAGACHGNANGKAGFKLSLRGQDPDFDLNALTRDQFGRRLDLVNPSQSLILLKPTTQLAHEGGKRFEVDSGEYEILRRWIADGARVDPATTPMLTKIDPFPKEEVLYEPMQEVQLHVRATFSDGSQSDVTKMAVYEAANSVAKIAPDGLVRRETAGETTILVRYLQCQEPVRLAFVPVRAQFLWKEVPENNYIDKAVFAKLRTLHMNPSELCSDEVFLRRAYLDLLGMLPTAEEARSFVADKRRAKRSDVIEALLERPEFADFWALKWSDLLRNEERVLDQKGVHNFYRWIRESLADNKPLDQFVRELIAARGSTYQNPPANYYRASRDAVTRAESAAQVFLGTRLQCAQCHNHPFDRWTQDDYYDWAALFAKVQYKVLENRRQDSNDQHEFKGEQIVYMARSAEMKNARTGKAASPRFLGGPSSAQESGQDELESLAAWVTSTNNQRFARSQVNRIWYHLMGRGIVDPIDDFRATNPASHPVLLENLAQDFVGHKFDLKHMIRTIMNSRAYQLSSAPNETNLDDEMNYSRVLVRRLTAEQMLDCPNQVIGVPSTFDGYPIGLRAAQLPGAHSERRRGQKIGGTDQFLELFGKPQRLLTCECERSGETTMGQAFQMISGPAVNDLLARPENRLARLLASGRSNHEIIEELYWVALTRAPTVAELEKTSKYLGDSADRRLALEDMTWGLLNAKEFLLRR
jgi:hypothetical protein